jgi:serine protease
MSENRRAKKTKRAPAERASTDRVVVRFREGVSLPYEQHAERHFDREGAKAWRKLSDSFPGISLSPLFGGLAEDEVRGLMDRIAERLRELRSAHRPLNLLACFAVECPPGVKRELVAEALGRWSIVESAFASNLARLWPQGKLVGSSGGNVPIVQTPAFVSALMGAGCGIKGSIGASTTVLDVESGWGPVGTFNPQDDVIYGYNDLDPNYSHGTAILEVISAIAPGASLKAISVKPTSLAKPDYHVALLSVICRVLEQDILKNMGIPKTSLSYGDIVLIPLATANGYPLEYQDTIIYDLIGLACALGLVVIESAGDTNNQLDLVPSTDSGAIIVGASHNDAGLSPMSYGHGSRVNCFAWGEGVLVPNYGSFGGTSAASAMVAGAAAAVQSIIASSLKFRLSPGALRALLSDPSINTKAGSPGIGVMPNVCNIKNSLGNVADVYVRDSVMPLDKGDPNGPGVVFNASPDIAIKNSMTDPSKDPNSGALLSDPIDNWSGSDHYVYVRLFNRGATATNVSVTVYWAEFATISDPLGWTVIGTKSINSLKYDISNGTLVRIPWSKSLLTAHTYGLVAVVNCKEDPPPSALAPYALSPNAIPPNAPAPGSPVQKSWDFSVNSVLANVFGVNPPPLTYLAYLDLVSYSNNIAWRGVTVSFTCFVVPQPFSKDEYIGISFIVPGAADQVRRAVLDLFATLPQGARLVISGPLWFLDQIPNRSPYHLIDEKQQIGYLPLFHYGRREFGQWDLPVGSRTELQLFVHIPPDAPATTYEVAVSHRYGNRAYGRVTWQIVHEDRKPPRQVKRLRAGSSKRKRTKR